MIWRRLVTLIGKLRTELMMELERNPQAVRQGAAAAACFVAAAAGMTAVAERAADQRADADWSARVLAFQQDLAEAKLGGADVSAAATMRLAAAPTPQGYRASAVSVLPANYESLPLARVAARPESTTLAGLRPFQPAALRRAADTTRAHRCLSEAIYYEARGESFQGQMAVAEVVVNRVRSSVYPDDFCAVVYQGSHRVTGCQFTFTCDGSKGRAPRGVAWDRAKMIAAQVMMGFARPMTHRATHYHTVDVDPVWSANLIETARIGAHIFYRFPSRSERLVLQAHALQAQQVAEGGALGDIETIAPAEPQV